MALDSHWWVLPPNQTLDLKAELFLQDDALCQRLGKELHEDRPGI
jgi:hypothetical protein